MDNDIKALVICCASVCFILVVFAGGLMFSQYLDHELDALKIENICTHDQ